MVNYLHKNMVIFMEKLNMTTCLKGNIKRTITSAKVKTQYKFPFKLYVLHINSFSKCLQEVEDTSDDAGGNVTGIRTVITFTRLSGNYSWFSQSGKRSGKTYTSWVFVIS